jgi:hypothetical protein
MRISCLLCLLLLLVGPVHGQPFQPKLVNAGPVFIDFGPVRMGATATVLFSMRNLTASPITYAGGGFTGFQGYFGFGSACAGTIAPGATCTQSYSFRPPDASGNAINASTMIQFSQGGQTQQVSLNFTGSGTATAAHIGPRVIDFGEQLLGSTRTVRVYVRNLDSTPLSVGGGGVSGGGFSSGAGTCASTVGAYGSCYYEMSFTPNQLGVASATTGIGTQTDVPVVTGNFPISLQGTGIDTVNLVSMRPVVLDFGAVVVGDELRTEMQFTNLGATQLNFAGGGFGGGFGFQTQVPFGPGCTSSTVSAGATCTVNSFFNPLTIGAVSDSSAFLFSRTGASQNVPISFSAIGVGQAGRVSPRRLNFGQVQVGSSISAQVTVTNTTRLPISGFLGGSVSSPFTSSNNCPSSLPVNASCQYTFGFNADAANAGAPLTTMTSISFSNTDGLQPVYTIELTAEAYDRLFFDGFE